MSLGVVLHIRNINSWLILYKYKEAVSYCNLSFTNKVFKMNRLLLILIFLFLSYNSICQSQWTKDRDSLLKVLSNSKEDSNKALTMTYLGAQYMYNQPDSAIFYFKALYQLSNKLNYVRGLVNSLSLQAAILSDQGKPYESIILDSQAIVIATKAHYLKGLAAVYNNIAIPYNNIGDHATSVDYYLKASLIDEQLHDDYNLAMAYANISGVYNEMKEYKKGYSYSLKGISLGHLLNNLAAVESGLINLGSFLIASKNYDSALIVLHDAKNLSKKLNDNGIAINVLNNICALYAEIGKLDLLKKNATELLHFAISINNKQGICNGWSSLSEYYFDIKNYSKATYYNRRVIQSAIKNHFAETLRYAYKSSANIELIQGNINGYKHYDKLKDSIENILLSDKIVKNTQEFEAKYALNKKQTEIDLLNKEQKIQQLTLKQQNFINWILASTLLAVILIGFLYYRNYLQKKKLLIADALLQQQRITELEKEKQLLAAQAVLQGQVEERTRLAKDLHDGLGGILSSAKYSFSHMKDNMIITPENAAAFEKSMNMLDKSISELRRVAHNMMPEALMKFGLDTALKDFCNSIEQSGAIQLTYQSFEIDEASISKTTAASVYRIIQELVNNILKHADAKKALVQLVRKDIALSITVEDDGKGFDKNILQNNDGIGYLNLQNRVTYLNGTIDIQTATNNGTSVNIEIPNITI